jgi:hypothetical protein
VAATAVSTSRIPLDKHGASLPELASSGDQLLRPVTLILHVSPLIAILGRLSRGVPSFKVAESSPER